MESTIIAIDLTKRVFQIHYVEPETGAIHSKVLKRAQLALDHRTLVHLGQGGNSGER